MRNSFLKFSFFLFLSSLFCEPLHIHLSTEKQGKEIYVFPIEIQESSLSSTYAEKLKEVFIFDANQSGVLYVAEKDPAKEESCQGKEIDKAAFASVWARAFIDYVVSFKVEKEQLILSLLHVKERKVQKFKAVTLTKNLSIDRRVMHRLFDALHEAIFHKPGIASGKILYAVRNARAGKGRHRWQSDIWMCDVDGCNAKLILRDGSYAMSPLAISYNNKGDLDQFLYVSYAQTVPKIFIRSIERKSIKKALTFPGQQLLPALSLQKDKIAYISDARGNPDLFVQSFNIHQGAVGKPYQLFASPGSAQASPSFSPDGKKIAFVSDKDGCPRIYTISLESSNRDIQLITKRNKENICPSWSPDGKKLAYSAKTNGIRQIWLYDFTTGEERQLTYGQGIKENPSFAPNSLHVVFNITEGEQTNLCIMHIEQKEFTKISEGSGVKHYPTWMGE